MVIGDGSDSPRAKILDFGLAKLSADPAFAPGDDDETQSKLARYRELSVIARSSTAFYGGNEIDVRETRRNLGARYLLQGSVWKVGDRIRLNVQLSDTEDGRSVWDSSYERELTAENLFDLQDDLTSRVVNEIAGTYGAPHLEEMLEYWRRPRSELRMELIRRHALSEGLTDHLIEGLTKAGLEGLGGATSSQ